MKAWYSTLEMQLLVNWQMQWGHTSSHNIRAGGSWYASNHNKLYRLNPGSKKTFTIQYSFATNVYKQDI